MKEQSAGRPASKRGRMWLWIALAVVAVLGLLTAVAAVVVLIHHALETVPALAEVGARPGTVPTGTVDLPTATDPAFMCGANDANAPNT